MKLEELLFNNVCQIPKYSPSASSETMKADAELIESQPISAFLLHARLESVFARACKNHSQYDAIKLLSATVFKKFDAKLGAL